MAEKLDTIDAIRAKRREYELRTSEAARRILEVSTELHLTWSEFDEVLGRVKDHAYICSEPAVPTKTDTDTQSSGS